jgi:hypothetical protein
MMPFRSRSRMAVLIAIVVCAIASPIAAQGTDRLAGTWVLNVAQSKFPAAPPTSQTTILEAVDGGLHEKVERVNADGTTTQWELTAKYDGRDYHVTGDPSRDTVALSRDARGIVTIVNKKAGAIVSRMRITVAPDGRTRDNVVMDPSGKTTGVLHFDLR